MDGAMDRAMDATAVGRRATTRRRRVPVGRLLLVVVGLALAVGIAGQVTSAGALAAQLAAADWRWLAVAALLEAAHLLAYGYLYETSFRAVDVASDARRLVPVLLASVFAKTAVPLTAAPAAAVFIDDATARGESGARASVGLVVVLVVDLVTALPFVLAGTVALVARGTLVPFAVGGTALFAGFIGVLLAILLLAARFPALLVLVLGLVRVVVDRLARLLRRTEPLPADWERRTTEQLVEAVVALPRHGRDLAAATGAGVVLHLLGLASLAGIFLAFGRPLDPAALAAGFAMSIVVFVIAVVPDGIGAVEGAMALVFVGLGMPTAAAILVTVAYRILTVWIPVGLGFWFARRLRLFGASTSAAADPSRRRTGGRPAVRPAVPRLPQPPALQPVPVEPEDR